MIRNYNSRNYDSKYCRKKQIRTHFKTWNSTSQQNCITCIKVFRRTVVKKFVYFLIKKWSIKNFPI